MVAPKEGWPGWPPVSAVVGPGDVLSPLLRGGALLLWPGKPCPSSSMGLWCVFHLLTPVSSAVSLAGWEGLEPGLKPAALPDSRRVCAETVSTNG